MQFKDYEYSRPDLDALKQNFENLVSQFSQANSMEEQNQTIAQINDLRNNFDTMYNLAYIRHTINTKDELYEKENNFFNANLPKFQVVVNDYYKALVNSKYKNELEKLWGPQLFRIAEMTCKTLDDQIVDELAKENQLASDYNRLKASAEIDFKDKTYNLTGLIPFMEDDNRETRKAASIAHWNFFEKNKAEFDKFYDDLVKVRHGIAQKLGYNNFVELGYNRMLRSDYSAKDIAQFRSLVHKYIVPLATELRQRQAKRIDAVDYKHFDMGYQFKTGNPTPKGSPDWIIENGKKMYAELSKETGDFFNYMLDRELMDVENKKGKAGGGYCTYIPNQQSPFIFSNFNGTSGDIDVLTHEAGHAFQVFESRNFTLPEYQWPTYEACEIHSMSMEFFTWPWMDSFFKEDTEKYKFQHLASAILFLPYGVAVDEFQHWVYENPNAKPEERRMEWKNIEAKYLPHLDYDGHPFLEAGGYWQKQGHIYEMPFYYIDYTLAQICALQFWNKAQTDKEASFADYLHLCKEGGSRSFLELVEFANLKSPFEESTMVEILKPVKAYLDSVDDAAL